MLDHNNLHGAMYAGMGLAVSVGLDHSIVGQLYFLLAMICFTWPRRQV